MASIPRVLIFLAVSGSLLLGIHLYLYRKWVRDVWTDPRAVRWGRRAFWILGGAAVLGRPILYVAGGSSTRLYALFVLGWLGFALAGFLVLVTLRGAWWIVRGASRLVGREDAPVSPERRLFLSRVLAGGSVLASAIGNGYGFREALGPAQVSELTVRLPRLPPALSGLTLVQLSDIHVGEISQERFIQDLVERCNGMRPDAVVITGDLVDGSVARLGRFVAPLQSLRARYGTFFVTGNHDYYSGADSWCGALEGLGIQVLRNRTVRLGDAGASLDLVGVDDWGARRTGRGYDLDRALEGRDPERAAVLLAHQPGNFEEAVRRGMGLQLSGHTHGGQVFPLTRLIGAAWPYHTGLYPLGESHIYVSRGTGFVGPPVRLESPPEIVRITLTT